VIFILQEGKLIIESDKFTLNQFKFENNCMLENAVVEYIIKGTPKFDEEGSISNAILICHKFDGNSFAIDELYPLTHDGGPLDLNKYFIISITSLGTSESCSPSTTHLRQKFPEYTFKDKVNFKKQFLKDKFNIEKVLGIVGTGMGGYEVFTWACEYPEDMEFIIIINSSYKTNGYRYVVSKSINSVMMASDDFSAGIYNESLSRLMVSINQILYSNYFSRKLFQEMSNDEIDYLMEEYIEQSLHRDIYDLKYQNDAIINYNVENQLSNIKAKTLVFYPSDDLYFSKKYDCLPLKDLIDDCEVVFFDLADDFYDGPIDFEKLVDILNPFLEDYCK